MLDATLRNPQERSARGWGRDFGRAEGSSGQKPAQLRGEGGAFVKFQSTEFFKSEFRGRRG